MYDIFAQINSWLEQGRSVALATVIKTWGSSPREVGAKMAVTDRGEMTGSVSGGCVEGAVIEAALETLENGEVKLLHFGIADETAWEVGLACGGEVDVFVQPLDRDLFDAQTAAIASEKIFGTLTRIRGAFADQSICLEGQADCFEYVSVVDDWVERARTAFEEGRTGILNEGSAVHLEEDVYFLDVQFPQPKLIIVGGGHISIALVRIASQVGYRTIVIDPRRAFGSKSRFADADELIQAWPDAAFLELEINRSSAIAVLSHDPKLDDPALMAALATNAFYVGALGSRGTQQKRRLRLLEAGLSTDQVDRIHGPIGLDLGGRSPEEIALAVMAEIVRVRNN
jgi:xanthine dehydrogenase accessory factor